MKRFDFDQLNAVSIAVLIEEDLGPAKAKSGGHHLAWLCPFHEDHHPSLDVNLRKNKAFCNVCGKGYRSMNWLTAYRKLDWRAAAQLLEGKLGLAETKVVYVQPKEDKPYAPPTADWQRAANEIVMLSAPELFNNTRQSNRVLDWLNRRGLTDETLRYWYIGYNPEARKIGGLWVWPGVILPCLMDDQLWGIKIRLLPEHPFNCQGCRTPMNAPGACPKCGKKNKYRSVTGSQPALFGADTCKGRRVCFGCEGEFDAMVTWQQASELGGVFTSTNGAGKDWRSEWFTSVMDAERIITLYDNDAAGDKGKSKLEALGRRVRSVRVPGECKDITDYHLTGDNKLFSWLCMVKRCALEAGYTPDVQWLPTMKITPVLPGHCAERAELESLQQRLNSALPATLRADYEHDINLLERILQTA